MGKYTYAQTVCIKKSGLALQRANALWPHCRIGVAVSGGMDSFVLLKTLKIRQGIVPFPFEILALHLNPGFDLSSHEILLAWLGEEKIAGHIEMTSFGPDAHSSLNRKKSACFYCALQRRKRLFNLCEKYKLTHLAFGHNADDLLTTFLLNFWRTSKIRGLPIKAAFFGGRLMVIRPLLLVEKGHIRQAARQWRLPIWANACPSAGATDRALVDDMAYALNSRISGARKSMINALASWELGQEELTKDSGAGRG